MSFSDLPIGVQIILVCLVFAGGIILWVLFAHPVSRYAMPQEIEYAPPYRTVCWQGYVFVEYTDVVAFQLFENSPNGLRAVQCQPKEPQP